MLQRQPPSLPARRIPPCWLMTDARLGRNPAQIVAAMPPRSAIIVRPYALDGSAAEKARTIRHIRHAARARRHILLYSGPGRLDGYDGRHGGLGCDLRPVPGKIRSMPVHSIAQARTARRLGVDVVLISPLWPTNSHPGAAGIGIAGFRRLQKAAGRPAIALGGMTRARFATLRRFGAAGWAAISAWSG